MTVARIFGAGAWPPRPVRSLLKPLGVSGAGMGAMSKALDVISQNIANAETTEGLAAGDLVISVAQVDEGPTMKRWRPRAQGRATRINKRTSHITLVVQPAGVAAEKATAKKRKSA